jgi:hypothetical protein
LVECIEARILLVDKGVHGIVGKGVRKRRGEAATSPVSCCLDQWVLFDEAHVASKAAEIPPEPVAPSGIERAAEAAAVPAPMKVASVVASMGAAEPRPELAGMTRGAEFRFFQRK